MKKLIIIFLLFSAFVYAAEDKKASDLVETTDIAGTDIFYIVDGGTGKYITGTNLFDLINTSLKLFGIVGDATGTGSLVFATSPTLVTPNLGTPSALVGTSITGTGAGFTAGTVTTNANLTGEVTSIGNAATIADSVSVTSWTMITPALGTPTALVGTNISGTAANLTAGIATHVVVTDNEATDEENEVTFAEDASAPGNNGLESDSGFTYNPSTGTLTAAEFSGGGASLTAVDAATVTNATLTTALTVNTGTLTLTADAGNDSVLTIGGGAVSVSGSNSGDDTDAETGDSATDFFDAGTIEHEWGGLQANVSAYTGLIGITEADTTVEVDALSELLTAMDDVTAFITDDDMPAASADPDIDAAGEIGRDTDGANETGDSSLRGYDGAAQFLYSRKLKTLNFTLISPDIIDAADLIPIWHNTTGMTFTITEVKAWSDDDDVNLEVEELTDMTDFTARTLCDTVVIETDGTGVYYDAGHAASAHSAIEHDHSIAIDFDITDTPDYVHMSITGWFNSDVD